MTGSWSFETQLVTDGKKISDYLIIPMLNLNAHLLYVIDNMTSAVKSFEVKMRVPVESCTRADYV